MTATDEDAGAARHGSAAGNGPLMRVVASTLVLLLVTATCAAERGAAFRQLLKGQRDFDGRSDAVEVKLPEEVRGQGQVTATAFVLSSLVVI
ncbi:MAG: hypothetical protein V2A58_01180 [Planctomycetota bacterium]